MNMPTSSSQNGLKQQVSQALAWNILFTPIKFIVETVGTIIRLTFLNKAEVGVLSLMSAASSSLGIFIDFGVDSTLPKVLPEIEKQYNNSIMQRFFRTIISLKLLALIVGVVLLPIWGAQLIQKMQRDAIEVYQQFPAKTTATLIENLVAYSWLFIGIIVILVVCGSLFDTLRSYLVGFFHQKAWNVITTAVALLLPLLSAVAVLSGAGVLGILTAMTLTAIISVAVTASHVWRINRAIPKFPSKIIVKVPSQIWRRFVPLTSITFLITTTDWLASHYFVVYWLDLQTTAILWVAYSFIKQIQSYTYTPLVGIQIPMFTRIRVNNDDQLERAFVTLSRVMVLLFIPSACGLLVVTPNLIMVQYPTYADAIGPALALIGFIFLEPFWGIAQNVLIVHENYADLLKTRIFSLLSIPILAILVPYIGIWAGVLAIGLSRMATGIAALYTVWFRYKLLLPGRFITKVFMISLGMIAIISPIALIFGVSSAAASISSRLASAAITLLTVLIGGGVFIGFMRAFHVLSPQDRVLLRELQFPLVRKIERWL